MRTVSLFALTGQAWNQSVGLLFRPFRWTVWWKLVLIGWLSGYLSAGCNVSFDLPDRPTEPTQTRQAATTTAVGGAQATAQIEPTEAAQPPKPEKPAIAYRDLQQGVSALGNALGRYAVFVGLGMAVYLAIALLFYWLMARCNFVFVDVLTTGAIAVIAPFRRHRDVARSFLWWIIGYGVVAWSLTILIVWRLVVGFLAAYAQVPDMPLPAFLEQHLATIGLMILGVVVGVILPAAIIWVWSTDFVVPIMYQRRCGVLAAWREYLGMVGRSPWEATKYLLWRALLGVLVAVAFGIVIILLILIWSIVGVLVALLGYGLARLVPALTWPLVVMGIILGAVWVGALVGAVYLSLVPVAVWIRTLSLLYLEALSAEFQFFPASPAAAQQGRA